MVCHLLTRYPRVFLPKPPPSHILGFSCNVDYLRKAFDGKTYDYKWEAPPAIRASDLPRRRGRRRFRWREVNHLLGSGISIRCSLRVLWNLYSGRTRCILRLHQEVTYIVYSAYGEGRAMNCILNIFILVPLRLRRLNSKP